MATEILKRMTEDGTHAVGSISSIQVKTLAHGAKATEAMDNWTLVELAGFDEEGSQLCKPLSAQTKKAYLVATPEQRFLGEDIAHFFNDKDEFVRPVLLEADYTRFEVSNFELDAGAGGSVESGQVAHFDTTKKKYIVSKESAANVGYAAAGYKFAVVGDTADTAGNFLQPTIRLMCIETL